MNRNIRRTMCILLALVLMTSSAVSYTYAEYARGSDMADNARAGIWGVNVDVTGSAFATKYESNKTYSGIDVSVKSSTTEDILAPGSTGTFTGINCTGTPEVSVQVEIDANLQLSNWVASGNYYCPLVITVNDVDYYGMNYSSSADFEAAVEGAIEKASATYPPNTNLAEVVDLNGNYHWYWDFGQDDATNAKDTALQGKAEVALSVKCTVYQAGGEIEDDEGLTDGNEFDTGDSGPIIWF